ncbi:DNA repair protein [Phanerochaete sordida]|uniref:DNA repair protein n=1 Tax=Phanerochaete sordida TaxID=48140 RepID=A0A9P3G3J8_9APHY|nr:DNA repair protein [Phanerochaete sordida]
MLKRTPTTTDGQAVDRLLESTRVNKPFKAPTLAVQREQPQRKRKRVSYKGAQADGDDDDDAPKSKKKKDMLDGPRDNNIQTAPVYKPKPFGQVSRRFSIPSMKNAEGEYVQRPLSNIALGIRPVANIIPRPLHDPMADHAIVLYDPTIDYRETDEERKEREAEEEKERAAKEAREKTAGMFNPHKSLREILGGGTKKKLNKKVPVVIDPRLGKVLRPHQVEGVQFMYKAATGMIVEHQYGCIMADEMGLGKTLQCITLMWTLLKQSPHAGRPTAERAIIACPASLVKNWGNELVKWLGPGTVGTVLLDGTDNLGKALRWMEQPRGRNCTNPVLITSYEYLRSLGESHPAICSLEIGLLLCDEGHRLKNTESKTWQVLSTLNAKRRVILTGTPIQNDLTEYFSLLSFALPTYLGTRNDFRKNFENTIVRGRDAEASDAVKQKSEEKLKELATLVSKFIIRRTNDLLSKYLPVKYEHVVFCRMSDIQREMYCHFVDHPRTKAELRGKEAKPLVAINILKKLVNHPELLPIGKEATRDDFDNKKDAEKEMEMCQVFKDTLPDGWGDRRHVHAEWSGKFLVLERFLDKMRAETNDKIVLISNYTSTMDVFEKMLRAKRYGYFRLDGKMSVKKRQEVVDKFNNPEGPEFVFLLSSKAGGCGINLIGANRLILFDPDWNPASDQQALARVWRDGQKKECFVYRFICTGTIEEKVFQRQAQKQSLSSAVVDEKEDVERFFSRDNLRQLFKYNDQTLCETHETFKCKRCKDGKQFLKSQALLYGDASTWNHFTNDELRNNHDDLLRAETGLPEISFVFQYISH